MNADWGNLPDAVTFTEAAILADKLGLFPGATADKLRHLARSRKDTTWPFGDPGEGRPHEYGKVANARKMGARVLMEHLKEHPPNPQGRGPDRKPRRKRAVE